MLVQQFAFVQAFGFRYQRFGFAAPAFLHGYGGQLEFGHGFFLAGKTYFEGFLEQAFAFGQVVLRTDGTQQEVVGSPFAAYQCMIRVFDAQQAAFGFFDIVLAHGQQGHDHPFVFEVGEQYDERQQDEEDPVSDVGHPELPYRTAGQGSHQEDS